MFLRCVPSLLNIYYKTFYLSINRLLPYAKAFNSAYALFLTAIGLARRISTMSGGELAQHEAQSTIYVNKKLVGQSGRYYIFERIF